MVTLKGDNMNTGTKIRTVLAIATSLNTAMMATDLTGFNNHTLDTIYKVVSIILNFIIVACVTYYNNDFTLEGEIGTNTTRELKSMRNECQEDCEEPEDSEIEDDE